MQTCHRNIYIFPSLSFQEKKSKVRAVSSGVTSGSSTPSSIGGASVQPSHPRHGGKGPIIDGTEKSPAEKDKSGLKHPTESALSPAVRDQNTPTVSSPAKRPADLALSPGAKCPSDVISPCSSSSSSAKKRRKEKDPSGKERGKDHSSGKKSSHSHKEKSRSKESKSKPHKSSKRDRKSTDSKPSHVDADRKSSSKSKHVATARDELTPVAAVAPKVKVELLAFEAELSTGEQSEFDPFEDGANFSANAALKPPAEKIRGRGLSALIAQLGEGDCDSDSHDELLSPLSATSPPVLFPEFQSSDHDDVPVGRLAHQVTDSLPGLKCEPDWLSPLVAETTPVSPLKGSPCSDKVQVDKSSPSDKYSVKKVSPLRLFPSSQEKPAKSKHDRPKKSKSDKKPKEHYSKDKENEESNSVAASRERKSDVVTDQPDHADRVSTPVRIATEPDPDNDASLLPLNQIDRSKQHAPNGESLSTLLDLQERLMMMTDARLLQKIVSIIEETGNYKINETTFDFDLYCLDRSTVQKLLEFLLQAAS